MLLQILVAESLQLLRDFCRLLISLLGCFLGLVPSWRSVLAKLLSLLRSPLTGRERSRVAVLDIAISRIPIFANKVESAVHIKVYNVILHIKSYTRLSLQYTSMCWYFISRAIQGTSITFDNSSEAFDEFLTILGDKVRLKGFDKYKGGLDTVHDLTGLYSVYTHWRSIEVMFHVSTLLPYEKNDPQAWMEALQDWKAPISNVHIVFWS